MVVLTLLLREHSGNITAGCSLAEDPNIFILSRITEGRIPHYQELSEEERLGICFNWPGSTFHLPMISEVLFANSIDVDIDPSRLSHIPGHRQLKPFTLVRLEEGQQQRNK